MKSPLTTNQIRSLLVNAFEGGSNYWYMIEGTDHPKYNDEDFSEGGKAQPKDEYFNWSQLIPTTKGCTLFVSAPDMDSDKERNHIAVSLNLVALQNGAKIMLQKYPKHFADVIAENDDATTGDVFLQCSMFGDVIFG